MHFSLLRLRYIFEGRNVHCVVQESEHLNLSAQFGKQLEPYFVSVSC